MIEAIQPYANAIIGLLGVVVGGIIVSLREWVAKRAERHRDASYSAIRLITILEEYANECVAVAGDDGTAYGRPAGRTESGEEVHEAQVRTPQPPTYPSDIAWRSLDERLMHRVLALPNKARSTDSYLSLAADFASFPDYSEVFESRMEGYARLGLDAFCIVDALKVRYRISVESRTDLGIDWDPQAHLKGLLEGFKKRDAEREERRKARQAQAAADGEIAP